MAASLSQSAVGQQVTQQVFGGLRVTIFDVVLATNDYVSDGISLASLVPGGTTLVGAVVLGQVGTLVGYVPVVDITNSKIALFESGTADAALDQVDNGASTAVTVRVAVWSV